MPEPHEVDDVPQPWRQRFDFFHEYGLPSSSPHARAAYKALPFGSRMRINSNFLAFLFGPFYFFAKGMWRKGLALLAAGGTVAIVMAVMDVPESVSRALSLGIAAVAMATANYAYYLHVVAQSQSWNFLEGFGRRSGA